MLPDDTRTIEQALGFAAEAIADGDPGRGRAALTWVLRQDPDNTAAWLWMACCAPDEDARQECYRRASGPAAPATGEGAQPGR